MEFEVWVLVDGSASRHQRFLIIKSIILIIHSHFSNQDMITPTTLIFFRNVTVGCMRVGACFGLNYNHINKDVEGGQVDQVERR